MNRVQTGVFGCIWQNDFKLLPFETKPMLNIKFHSRTTYEKQIMPRWTQHMGNAFGLYNQTYSFIKIEPHDLLPVHIDDCDNYVKEKNVDTSITHIALLMLEDWEPGQYLEIDGVPYTKWVKGTWFSFKSDVEYGYSNIGNTPWYIMYVNGLSIYTGTLTGLCYYNFVDISADGRVSHPFIQHTIIPAIDDESFTSQMVYFGNSYIKDLANLNHSQHGIDYLNKHGLKIHLFEPICSYSIAQPERTIYGTRHTQGFYSEFSHTEPAHNLRAEELDSIQEYVIRNKLEKVTVATGEYNVQKHYPHYHRMELVTNDLFLKTQKKIKGVDPNPNYEFEKKFISLNWRFTNHRHLISTFLAQYPGYYSWYFKCLPEHLGSHLYFDLNSWETKHPDHYHRLLQNANYINENGPLTVDKKEGSANWIAPNVPMMIWPQVHGIDAGVTPALFNGVDNHLEPYYRDIFVDIVTESRFAQPTGNFSEKTFQPMQYKKPFILVAPPYTLEYVKSYGFKTFSDYWDESYDQEEDHEKRLVKIFDLIDFINNKSTEELREIYRDMQLILNHNLEVFEQVFATPTYRLEDR